MSVSHSCILLGYFENAIGDLLSYQFSIVRNGLAQKLHES